jgi:hypothetical protein
MGDLVERAFSITGLRLEVTDGFWDLCFNELKGELLRRLGKLGGGLRTSNPGQTLSGIEHRLMSVKPLMDIGATGMRCQSTYRRSISTLKSSCILKMP